MQLEYFRGLVEAVQHKSLSQASERLNLTHPALSKQIRKLEDYYGAALLRRSAAGVEPTEAGRLLYDRIRPILRDLSTLQNDMTAYTGLKRIALGSLPSAAAYYLPPLIVKLESKGITAEITVKPTSEELIELLRTAFLDAAVVDSQLRQFLMDEAAVHRTAVRRRAAESSLCVLRLHRHGNRRPGAARFAPAGVQHPNVRHPSA